MDEDLLDALNEKAEHDGISRSEAIRDAVRSWTRIADDHSRYEGPTAARTRYCRTTDVGGVLA